MNLTDKQRDALELLADCPHGLTEDLLVLVYDFDRKILAGFVDASLVTAQRHVGEAGGEKIEVVRLRITGAGREALKSRRT
jgi:hypothetical protein